MKNKLMFLLMIMGLGMNSSAQEIPSLDWDKLSETRPWEKTEVWDPEPTMVRPDLDRRIPFDAIILFDGANLDAWQKPQFKGEMATKEQAEAMLKVPGPDGYDAADWHVEPGYYFQVKPGSGAIETKEKFGDVQLHIEWLSPVDEEKSGQGYSNSGLFLMGLYEVQILNSFNNRTYANGQAGSIYKQYPPLVNASLPPGEWQSYDVIFTAPVFEGDELVSPAYMTVMHNGVLVQNHVALEGPTFYIGASDYIPHSSERSLRLQDHGDEIKFRNIWLRKI